MSANRVPAALVFVVGVLACEGSRSDALRLAVVDTLPNGGIAIRNLRPDGVGVEPLQWSVRVDLILGGAGARGPEAFGSVAGLAVDGNGQIYVLDEQAAAVQVFASNGEFIRTLGRPGAGPGEFRSPVGLALMGDSALWIADPLQGRYTLLDTGGGVIRTVPRPAGGLNWSLMRPWQGGGDRFGRLYDFAIINEELRIFSIGPLGATVEVSGQVPDTLQEEWLLVGPGGELRASAPVPFAPSMIRHIDRAGTLWSGFNASYEIARQTLDGDILLVIAMEMTPVAVSSSEVDSIWSGYGAFLRGGGRVEGPPVPQQKPAYRWMVTDDEGRLWVRSFNSAGLGPELEVFDSSGFHLASVDLPFALGEHTLPTVHEGLIYAASFDESGAPIVVAGPISQRENK